MEESAYGRLDAPMGSHIVTPRRGYLHHGIYVGDGRVVHYAGLCHGLHRGPVEEVAVSRFARGRPVWILSDGVPNFDPQETVRRARSRLGEDCYRLLTNNCEHFCEWCLRGTPRSRQIEALLRQPGRALRAMMGLIAWAVSLIAVAGVFVAPYPASAQTAPGTPHDATLCVACHGMHGEGAPTGAPRLAGQNAEYMSHALSMFKARTRASPIMQPIAQTLSDAQITELAQYFSKQSAPLADAHSAVAPQLLPAGKQLAEVGAINVAACFSCHGTQGRGNGARFPSVTGQPARFVIDRLHEFQARAREKAPQPGTMTAVAATMDEKQIEAAAAYLSRLEN